MADQRQVAVPQDQGSAAVSRATAEAQADAAENPRDEIEGGGVFIVNGVKVDANGQPVKEAESTERSERSEAVEPAPQVKPAERRT
jgi:hypothetical protein